MHRLSLAAVLPIHPTLLHLDGQPVQALGWLRSGRPIWPVRGCAPDDDESDDDDDSKDNDTDDAGKDDADDKQLGPAGEKALQAEKDKRRNAQAKLREWTALGKTPAEIQALIDGVKKAGDDGAPDVEELRKQARAEVQLERQRERVLDKIEARAARGFADPDDAAALLLRGADINDYLDDDGKVDLEAIEEGLKALLDKKPYLAAQGGKRFEGGADGGRRKDAPAKATSLQDAVAKRMTAGGSTR